VSLRARLAIAAGVAVALAVVAVAVAAYAGTRSQLLGQKDSQLVGLRDQVLHGGGGPQGGGAGGPDGGQQAQNGIGGFVPFAGEGPCVRDEGTGIDNPRGQPFGGPAGVVTLVYPRSCGGGTYTQSGQSSIPVDARMQALADSGQGHYYTDKTASGTHLRVLVTGIGQDGAIAVALPLTDVDNSLSNLLLLMVVIAVAGIALAALFGVLVAQTALRPIARFTRQTEAIAANPERLDQRVEEHGGDELERLARTFNATLDALERSLQAQRNLVADASHELRTPIATLRANLQLLRDESLLSQDDREALRNDMIEELDELTGLVGDVVELARGSKPTGEATEVRLDEIVDDLVERTRRRAPQLTVTADLEQTLVRGEGDRIARAVSNLLGNAVKWSSDGGVIEVGLRDGVVTVRDHGAGFHEEDLPYVFDRFHRARDARSKPGSGLGLAIVRQAAEAHGGSAEAANAPGGGAIVRVSFGPPLAVDPGADAAAGMSRDSSRAGSPSR
jgi:two-component system sensor histidine kinase MprB